MTEYYKNKSYTRQLIEIFFDDIVAEDIRIPMFSSSARFSKLKLKNFVLTSYHELWQIYIRYEVEINDSNKT